MPVRLNGSTSGYTELSAPAVAGNNTLSLPTGNGTANQFLKNGSTAGSLGWSSMVEDSSGRLLVGTSTSTNNIVSQTNLALVTTGSANVGGATLTTYPGTTQDRSSSIIFQRSRGTTDGSMTAVASGDRLGDLIFSGSDGTSFQLGARIQAFVDGTVSDVNNSVPSRLVFSTTATSDTSPTERLRITSDGTLQLRNSPGIDFSQIQTNAPGVGSETLDSYEEGTWTGTATLGGGTGTVVDEVYTKIGNFVHISCTLNFSGASGGCNIAGLPFAVSSTPVGIGREDASSGYAIFCRATSGTTFDVWDTQGIGNPSPFNVSAGNFRITMTYRV